MLSTLERSIDYSNKIVEDLLEYSREITLEPEVTTPKSLLSASFELVKKPANIQIVDSSEDNPNIKVDAVKMTRVFVNIIRNAFDAMPNGGTLTTSSKTAGNNLELHFIDTGQGMSQETLSKLWIPLFTTKAKGMGFGLSICKRIVEAHGGKISAQSAVGKGTTIAITIPVVEL
jgi:signal transduction histidine kinase